VNVFLLIYVRALILNEPFIITMDTSVRVTMELLLLPMQRSTVVALSLEVSLLDSKHVTVLSAIIYLLLKVSYLIPRKKGPLKKLVEISGEEIHFL
jgi:hypothetical protein